MRPLKILVVEDHPLMAEAIRMSLSGSDQFELVGTAGSARDAFALAEQKQPDVVLLDFHLPDADGMHVVNTLVRAGKNAKVIVFSADDGPDLIDRVLRAGASAFITKRIDPVDLPSALRQALDQTLYQPLHLNPLVGNGASDGAGLDLSERDRQILAALAEGLSNSQIAQRLWVAEQTVKFHLTSIYRKLGVSSRTEAVAAAYGRGLVEQSPLTQASR